MITPFLILTLILGYTRASLLASEQSDLKSYTQMVVIPDVQGDHDSFLRSLWIASYKIEPRRFDGFEFFKAAVRSIVRGESDTVVPTITSKVALFVMGAVFDTLHPSLSDKIAKSVPKVFGWQPVEPEPDSLHHGYKVGGTLFVDDRAEIDWVNRYFRRKDESLCDVLELLSATHIIVNHPYFLDRAGQAFCGGNIFFARVQTRASPHAFVVQLEKGKSKSIMSLSVENGLIQKQVLFESSLIAKAGRTMRSIGRSKKRPVLEFARQAMTRDFPSWLPAEGHMSPHVPVVTASVTDAVLTKYGVLMKEYDSYAGPGSRTCPPSELYVDGQPADFGYDLHSEREQEKPRVYFGFDDQFSDDYGPMRDDGVKFLVKTVAPRRNDWNRVVDSEQELRRRFSSLSMDRAVHAAIRDLDKYSLVMHAFTEYTAKSLERSCEVATTVTEFGGDFYLGMLKDKMGNRPVDLARIAARCIMILEALHARGLVHGNVQADSFVFADMKDPAATLKILEFGGARPFSAGETKRMAVLRLGAPLSRKADMVQLSKMLVLLFGADRTGPKVLTEFVAAVQELAAEQEPDYSKWIGVFSEAESFGSLY